MKDEFSQNRTAVSAKPSRKRLHRGALLAAAVSLALCSASVAAAQPTNDPSAAGTTIRYVKSRLLVQPKAGLTPAEFDKILKPHGARRTHYLPQINVHVIELPAQANEMAVANIMRGNPHIEFAELDQALEPNLTVNDPYYTNSWHLPKIGAPQAWDIKTGGGVVIAILDTGVDSTHPDLAPQMVAGWNSYDNNNNTADVHGHGTMVSGMAVAAGNNLAGSAGVAFGAKLMPIRISDSSGYAYFSTMAAGVNWAADRGARVASISFSGAAGSSTVMSAAQYMRNKGGVVLVSAGNSGSLLSYATSDYITVLGASDSSNNVASFSDYGKFVDLVAPGVSIFSTKRGGGYGSGSGTSASSPIAAGVYALMMSANSTLSPASLDNIIFSTATDLGVAGKDEKSGWGVVNASAAVAKAAQAASSDTTAPSTAITSPGSGSKVSGLVPVSVSATDNVSVARVELYVNGSLYATDTLSPYGFSWDTSTLADGAATLVAKAYDGAGNSSSSSISVTVASDTTPPTVSIQNPNNGQTVSGTVTVSASATDDKKIASMSLLIDGKEVAKVYGASLSYNWDTSASTQTKKGGGGASGGGRKRSSTASTTRSVQVIALDPAGNKGEQSVFVTTQ